MTIQGVTNYLTASEEQKLLTPFRERVLQKIYEVAWAELGASLESAFVSAWSNPGESDSDILVLNIVADADWSEIRRVRKSLLQAIAEVSESWTEAESDDYSRRIYFDLMPVDV